MHDLLAALRRDEVGEAVRPAQLGRDMSAVMGRPEQPEFGHWRIGRSGADVAIGMVGRQVVGEPAVEVEQLLGEVVDAQRARSVHQSSRCASVGTRRAADAQINPTRELGGDRAEVLGHLERAVMRQHHAAGADPDVLGSGGNLRDQQLR